MTYAESYIQINNTWHLHLASAFNSKDFRAYSVWQFNQL